MYTREEASQVRQAFWKAYGQYMALQPSAAGVRVNWINYKTGIRQLSFKMDADKERAYIQIRLSNQDAGIRELMIEQFRQLKSLLDGYLGEAWEWMEDQLDEYGHPYSAIGTVLEGVNIFNRHDWPALIQFFKPRMLALDAFWADAQYSFELFK